MPATDVRMIRWVPNQTTTIGTKVYKRTCDTSVKEILQKYDILQDEVSIMPRIRIGKNGDKVRIEVGIPPIIRQDDGSDECMRISRRKPI
uniref:Uncharacterized protein n=1 Tax=Candidatus Kentrum sp. LFY TaxID=2126342 RepID=A0A450WAT9_9GAMM|nr:MAG: hypothetical protein BECKLFY1418C_GA0070996_100627 [Candidatus Kentron sp. LFY]